MNKFVKSGAKLSVLITWIFIATLFADGANLDDLFSDAVVIHSDEDSISQYAFGLVTPPPESALPIEHLPPQVPQKQDNPKKAPAAPGRIVFDQDSPSLAANTTISPDSISLFPQLTQQFYQSPSLGQSLNVLLCTLLI
jgi:hypothetical protein